MINEKYKFALATLLVNLKQTNHNLYDMIIIYHDCLTDNDKILLRQIETKLTFISYTKEDCIKEHNMDKNLLKIDVFSHYALTKYKVLSHLQDFNKVLFLDCDILIRGKIDDLFEIQGCAVYRQGASFRTIMDRFCSKFLNKNFVNDFPYFTNLNTQLIDKYGKILQGGVFLFDSSLDYNKLLLDAKEFVEQFYMFPMCVDELSIQYALVKNNILPYFLDKDEIYNIRPHRETVYTKCKMIHFEGRSKIWNSNELQIAFPMWRIYYEQQKAITSFACDESSWLTIDDIYLQIADCCWRQKRLWDLKNRWQCIIKYLNGFPEPLQLISNLDGKYIRLKFPDSDKGIFYDIVFDSDETIHCGLWISKTVLSNDLRVILEKLSNITNTNLYDEHKQDKLFYIEEQKYAIYCRSLSFDDSKIKQIFNELYNKTKFIITIQ